MPRLVIFDMAGVLYDASYEKSMKKEIRTMLKKNIPKRIDKKDAKWITLSKASKVGKITLRHARLKYLKYVGIKASLITEYGRIERKWMNRIKPKDRKMILYLLKLRKMGIKIVVLSNTSHTTRNRINILRRLGIFKLVDGIFCSSEIGCTKPHRSAYLTVLKALKIQRGDAVFIGHETSEVQGAMNAGIRAVMFKGSIKNIFSDIIKG